MNIAMIIVYVIVAIVLLVLVDKIKNKRLYLMLKQFPSYRTYPLIGNLHLLRGSHDGNTYNYCDNFKIIQRDFSFK